MTKAVDDIQKNVSSLLRSFKEGKREFEAPLQSISKTVGKLECNQKIFITEKEFRMSEIQSFLQFQPLPPPRSELPGFGPDYYEEIFHDIFICCSSNAVVPRTIRIGRHPNGQRRIQD